MHYSECKNKIVPKFNAKFIIADNLVIAICNHKVQVTNWSSEL